MTTPLFHFQSRPGHSPHQHTVTGNWPGSIACSNPTTPDATSEGNFFTFDRSAPMQGDNYIPNPRGNFYHSKNNSDSGSSYGDQVFNPILSPSPYDDARLHLRSDGQPTQAPSHHPRRQSHATQPLLSMDLSEDARAQYTGQLNQPPHLPSPQSNASFGHSQMLSTANFGNASLFHAYGFGSMPLITAGQFNTNGGLHATLPPFQHVSESQIYGNSTQDALRYALHANQAAVQTRHQVPFNATGLDPQTLQAVAFASIQQYSHDRPSSSSDGSPSMNTPGYTHVGNAFPVGGPYIDPNSHGWQGHSRSLTSTPSLAENSPNLSGSPSLTQTSFVGSIPTATLAPPSLFPQRVAEELSPPPVAASPSSPKSNKRTTKRKSNSSTASSSRRSQSVVVSVSPDPTPSFVPLHVRVAQLPDKKRRMFEQACGNRWTKSYNGDSTDDQGTDKANLIVLEAFYALIGSTELAKQLEIPDDLVKPLLSTELLPKDGGKKGSRGGAAGYKCLWAGCTKELIKRQDHARNHVREHCGSKPQSCGGGGVKGCGQRFLRTDDLKRHQKSHCSVLRSGPGRRPRSIRGVHHDDSDEEDDGFSEESRSTEGGDDDDFHLPSREMAPATFTRERPSRSRTQKAPTTSIFSSESSSDGDEEDEEAARFARHQTSNIRGASLQNAMQDEGGARMLMQDANGSALVVHRDS